MKKYLIDTNICIYYMKGMYQLDKTFDKVDFRNCYISEITLAELKFGVENSEHKEKNKKALNNFLSGVTVIPIFSCPGYVCKRKSKIAENRDAN